MKKLQFYIVDVFTEQRYSGNQLAVIAGAENLPEKDMQKIAKEMNYSETTFILSKKKRIKIGMIIIICNMLSVISFQ